MRLTESMARTEPVNVVGYGTYAPGQVRFVGARIVSQPSFWRRVWNRLTGRATVRTVQYEFEGRGS